MEFEPRLLAREDLPLLGKRVLLTTPRNYAGLFSKPLIERGARVVILPAFEIWPMGDYRELDQALNRLSGYDWVIFSSQNGVEAFLSRLQSLGGSAEVLGKVKLAALKADTEPFAKTGLKFDLIPPKSTLDGLCEEMARQGIKNGRALVPLPEFCGIDEPLVISDFLEKLKCLGLETHRVPAYCTCRLSDAESVSVEKRLLLGGEVDFVLFTSNAEISNLVALLGDDWPVLNRTVVVCLSKVEAESAAALGIKVAIVVEKSRPTGLVAATVQTIELYLKSREKPAVGP